VLCSSKKGDEGTHVVAMLGRVVAALGCCIGNLELMGNLCCCHVSHIAATVGHVVAVLGCTLDMVGVRRDEEGFTPPGHIKNGIRCDEKLRMGETLLITLLCLQKLCI